MWLKQPLLLWTELKGQPIILLIGMVIILFSHALLFLVFFFLALATRILILMLFPGLGCNWCVFIVKYEVLLDAFLILLWNRPTKFLLLYVYMYYSYMSNDTFFCSCQLKLYCAQVDHLSW